MLRTSWIAVGLGLLAGCGTTSDPDADSSASASGTGTTSGGAGTETPGTTTTTTDDTSTGAETTSGGSSGEQTTGAPAPECGGECLADVVASAYNTCESEIGREFPCDAPRPCDRAIAQCDSDGENCTYGDGDADAYVAAVACTLEELREGTAGRYGFVYTEESDPPGAGNGMDLVFDADVQRDGSVQTLDSFDLGKDEVVILLNDSDVSCIQAGLADIGRPTNPAEAGFVSNDIKVAISACSTLCLEVFEGFVDFPDDLSCF